MIRALTLPLALVFAAVGARSAEPPPGGADTAPAERYRTCLAEARVDPAAALAAARSWEETGGGNPARHCAATAMLNAGDAAGGARMIEELGRELAASDPWSAAGLFDDAARIWLRAKEPVRARNAVLEGLDIRPGDIDLLVTLSTVNVALEDYWAAIDALGEAIAAAPDRGDLYLLRAAAHRFLGNYELALDDADRATSLLPNDPAPWLERGNIHRLADDVAEAEQDWRRAIAIAPGTAAATAAQDNLNRLRQ